MPTKSSGEAIVFSSSSLYLGDSPPASARYASVYLPSSITVMNPAFRSRVAASATLTCSGSSMIGMATPMFSAKPTFVPAGPPARIACTARPRAEHGVMLDLPQLRVGEPHPRCAPELDRLAADLHVDELVSALHERAELVDREVVLH
jgi:hypothetical protein